MSKITKTSPPIEAFDLINEVLSLLEAIHMMAGGSLRDSDEVTAFQIVVRHAKETLDAACQMLAGESFDGEAA